MTKCSHAFSKIDTLIKVPIKMSNEAIIKSKGKGNVAVQIKKGTRLIKDVLYFSGLD